jgi:8-oxo-dGTP diphosphatase
MDLIKVVCAIVCHQKQYFICRRRPGKSLEGYWEFPGGKIEATESHHEALRRELQEELGMEIDIKSFVGQSVFDYGNFKIELNAYLCDLIQYDGLLTDHDCAVWVDYQDLNNYQIAPADLPFLKMLGENDFN